MAIEIVIATKGNWQFYLGKGLMETYGAWIRNRVEAKSFVKPWS
jgi:hypothetical protein